MGSELQVRIDNVLIHSVNPGFVLLGVRDQELSLNGLVELKITNKQHIFIVIYDPDPECLTSL